MTTPIERLVAAARTVLMRRRSAFARDDEFAILDMLAIGDVNGERNAQFLAGLSAARDGADTTNCHFAHFSSREKTSAWEQGNRVGLYWAKFRRARMLREAAGGQSDG